MKHTYNAFPDLQTKFFHKQCVIWRFLQSFNEFPHKLHILEISGATQGSNQEESLQQEVSPAKLFQNNETNPKRFIPKRPVMREKYNETNAKVWINIGSTREPFAGTGQNHKQDENTSGTECVKNFLSMNFNIGST